MEKFQNSPLILIGNGNSDHLNTVKDTLLDSGCTLSIATTGEQLLLNAQSEIPDLIIISEPISNGDGYELCKSLKSNTVTSRIPVIILISNPNEELVIRAFEAGGADYISRPFIKQELISRVRTHLELTYVQKRIDKLSFYDELLNIPNKRFFNRYFEHEWKCAVREQTPISVLMIDIDHFKEFNDTHGHIEGDRCLLNVSMALQSCITRPGDFIARFGGEQFVCVLPHTNREGAIQIAEEIRESVESLELITENDNTSTSVTVSIGCNTSIPDGPDDMLRFVTDADKVLYTAKSTGRNRICAV